MVVTELGILGRISMDGRTSVVFPAKWTAGSEEAGLDEHSEHGDWSEVVQGAGLELGC